MRAMRIAVPFLLPLLQGCLSIQERTVPSGAAVTAAPKPANCEIAVYRTKLDAPYDEISAIQVEGTKGMFLASLTDLQARLKARACELGADAVLVTQDYTVRSDSAVMTGVAVKYRQSDSRLQNR